MQPFVAGGKMPKEPKDNTGKIAIIIETIANSMVEKPFLELFVLKQYLFFLLNKLII